MDIHAATVTVFAASSLADALGEIAEPDQKETAPPAIRFLRHLRSDAAAKVFRKHGFLVLP